MAAVQQPSSPQPGLTSFAIYEDPQDREPMSPGEMYEGDDYHTSERSFAMTEDAGSGSESRQQEPLDEPMPYRSSYTSRKSIGSSRDPRRSSQYSFISAIPSESSISSKPMPANEAGARSRPERPLFRNPESVRAMQMSSPPQLPAFEPTRDRTKGYVTATPSRSGRSETPVSRPSGSRRRSIREPASPRPTPTPQQAPLVLLHVTILPMQVPYSHDVMTRIMPDWLVENYKLLEEKLQDIILMRRGLLIPHPRDEYDLLEERILESLELKTPRILPCGHFVPPEDDSDREDEDDTASVGDENTGRGSRMSGGTLTEGSVREETTSTAGDHSMCMDCHRHLKKPGKGVGAGTRKWDIKIYAANGLMRAAAWGACWNDMERCDVEIHPWVPEEVRKTLETRAKEEQEADKRKQMYAVELQRQIQEAAAKTKLLEEEANESKRREEEELQKSFEAAAAALQKSIEEKAAEKKKFEEDLAVKLEEAKEAVRLELEARALAESSAVAERLRALEIVMKEQEKAEAELQASRRRSSSQIPLGTLLKNYVLLLLSDRRNLVILLLTAVVAYMSMNMDAPWRQQLSSAQILELPNEFVQPEPNFNAAVTATTTSVSWSTLTVTEIQTANSMHATAAPLVEMMKSQPEVGETGVELVQDPTTDVELATESAELETSQLSIGEEQVSDSKPLSIEATSQQSCISAPVFEAPAALCVV